MIMTGARDGVFFQWIHANSKTCGMVSHWCDFDGSDGLYEYDMMVVPNAPEGTESLVDGLG